MIPLRMTNYKLAEGWPPAIIIHHTACKIDKPELSIDKANFQTQKFHNTNYRIYRKETGFNFIVDRVGDDFQVVVSQPLMTLCEFEDIEERYWRAIHIALMGNYNKDIPMTRLYKALSYRLLAPIMRLFLLTESDILLHSAISTDDNTTCPGEFVDMEKLKMNLRTVFRRRSLTRRK